MRVLVTGHRGYIGSVLVGVLRHARMEVVGLDCDYFAGCDFGRMRESVPAFEMDVRDVEFTDLLSFDAVVHLATLPDNGSCGNDSAAIGEINDWATIRLADCCRKAGITHFIHISSAHQTTCVQELLRSANQRFCPMVLRTGEVYGMSPRLRLDRVVNDMAAAAVTVEHVRVPGDGSAFRSLVHVEDLARAVAAVLTAPGEFSDGAAFDVLAPNETYRLIEIADVVVEVVGSATRSVGRYATDETSFRADGAWFARNFPSFSFRWNLRKGVQQLVFALRSGGLTQVDWRSDRFRRSGHLARIQRRGEVDEHLRRKIYHGVTDCATGEPLTSHA